VPISSVFTLSPIPVTKALLPTAAAKHVRAAQLLHGHRRNPDFTLGTSRDPCPGGGHKRIKKRHQSNPGLAKRNGGQLCPPPLSFSLFGC
jgi:hypothetical protein